MPLTPDIAQRVAEGNSFEDAGMREQAEAAYLDAIAQLEEGDEELIGRITINLGTNASDDGRPADAITFYTQAIDVLEGLKGEALLESAHAHYNLARVYFRTDGPEAVRYADEALARYERYPFTSAVDLADARILQVVAWGRFGHAITEQHLYETWDAAREHPASSLNYTLAIQFAAMLVTVVHSQRPGDYEATISEISAWAGPSVADELRAAVEGHA